jgi:hypothetical protein
MTTKFQDYDVFNLIDEEQGSETNALVSSLAGVASGLIKVPEGIISLGAELIDLGFDTNTAAKVEKAFDTINVFQDVADDRAIGKLLETLVQVGVPGTVGFKLASSAVKAKKAGNYANLSSPNITKALNRTNDLNKKAKTKRFVAGVAGGAAGEAFVADVEDIGSLGDTFEAGPTQLTEVTDEGGKEDAARKLLNRVKFGSESILVTPIVYGAAKGIKAAATRGKNLEFSNSKLDKFFNKIFSTVRARGAKPQKIFEEKMAETATGMADTNRAMELVKNLDREIDKMFPTLKTTFSKSTGKEKSKILKDINDALFDGNLDEEISEATVNRLTDVLKTKGLDDTGVQNIFQNLKNARQVFSQLISASSNAPKDVAELKTLIGSRAKDYLGDTYRIFEDKSSIPFLSYKPTEEATQNVKELFKRYHRFANRNNPNFDPIKNALTDLEADTLVNNIYKSALQQKTPGKLPFFKYINLTPMTDDVTSKKFFKQVVTRDIGDQQVSQVVGEGSKIFREYFGKMQDPRFSIYNGMTKLSGVARKNELLERLLQNDAAVKAAVTDATEVGERGFFFTADEVKNLKAERALPNQEIVELDKYLSPFFKDEYVVNPMQGMYTSKAIAEALGESQKAFKFLFDADSENFAVRGFNFAYRNLLLAPKGAAQIAKTILSPVTHFRNFFSATGFSAANGVMVDMVTNPAQTTKAFADAFGPLQVGTRSEAANARYRELLKLGVVNSQVQLGDIKNLLKDVRFGDNVDLDKPLASMGKKLFGLGKRGVKKGVKFAEDLYTAEDDFFKIANFAIERNRLKNAYTKAGREFTEEFLDQEAANIVRNTVPNYAYVSDTVRLLRRLPLGTFMSFPSEILRTTTNIAQRAIREIKDPALRDIGYKRLFGLTTVLAAAPYGIQKGFQSLYDVTNEELDALKRYLPEWSRNSTILPIRDEDTGELKYVDFSHGNAYDTAIRPIQTLLNNIQQGITDEDVLMKGLLGGMAEAAGELASPFISEAIYTQALADIFLREGRTREGSQIYTETQLKTEPGKAIQNSIEHVAESLVPFSYPTLTRIYQAAADKPSERGEFFELPDELTGFFGFRQVKVDPIKAMGFKLAGYQKGIREARSLFTGGEESVLKGGPKTPNDIIRRFIQANKAKFLVQKELKKDIEAAELLGVDDFDLRREFRERQLTKDFNRLNNDIFDPYVPSDNIRREFRQMSENLGISNPYLDALMDINDIVLDLRGLSFDDDFDEFINVEDYIQDESEPVASLPLPNMPMPSANVVQTSQMPAPGTMNQGLTAVENALLSDEEKQIRLRQRGLA